MNKALVNIKAAIAAAALLVGGLVAAPSLYPWFEPAALLYGTHGVDVSHHQGPIDWSAVAGDGVTFAFIKATEGGDFVDPRFAENWRAAAAAGVRRGAYHFFTQCRSGEQQAANFVRVVPSDAAALPPVIDAEHMGPCRNNPPMADVVAEIKALLDRLEAHYRKRPLIYTTRDFHDAYLKGRLPDERYWIRSLVLPPSLRPKRWVVWQYHNRGRRSGITGPVDLNVLRCNPATEKGLATSATFIPQSCP